MLKGQHSFHQPCDTSGRFGVSDISFNRTDIQGVAFGSILGVNLCQGLNFYGVSQRRTRTVGFNILDLIRLDTGILKRLSNDGLL